MTKKHSLWDKIIAIVFIATGATIISDLVIDYVAESVNNTPLVLLAVAFVMILLGWKLTEWM